MASTVLSGTPAAVSVPSVAVPTLAINAPAPNGNARLIMECSTGTFATQYMTGVSGGGLSQDQISLWLYSATVGGGGENPVWDGYGLGNGYCAMAANLGRPFDGARLGVVVGTGAPQTVAVPSITANSVIQMAYLDGATAAVGSVAPAVVIPAPPALPSEFSVTLPAGSRFSYVVYG